MIYFPRIFLLPCPKGKKNYLTNIQEFASSVFQEEHVQKSDVFRCEVSFSHFVKETILLPQTNRTFVNKLQRMLGGLKFSLIRDKISFCSKKFAADHESKNTFCMVYSV